MQRISICVMVISYIVALDLITVADLISLLNSIPTYKQLFLSAE